MEVNGDLYQEYPPFQATYMKGEVNFTVRGDDYQQVVQDMARMAMVWSKLVASKGDKSSVGPLNGEHQKCPKCGEGELVEKQGKFGPFLACNRYPECKYIHNDKGGQG